MEDMATLAVNPGLLEGVAPPSVPQGSAHFHEMEDSAIMLELRAGNMAGFDYLIQKYRKPIVNFMYRMVHNQAIAEELAQEVFLRVYGSRETSPRRGPLQHLALSHRDQPRRQPCARHPA